MQSTWSVVASLVSSASLGAILVYFWEERRRTQFVNDSTEASRALAVSDARLADASTRLTEAATAIAEREHALSDAEQARTHLDTQQKVGEQKIRDLESRFKEAQEVFARGENDSRTVGIQLADTRANLASLTADRDNLKVRLEEQKTWINEQTKLFEERVLATAQRVMEERGRTFTEQNKKEIDSVVTPFKEQLAEFRHRVDHIYTADTRERGQLAQQIVHLTSLNQTVSAQAERLTKALTITSKSAGTWGETILHKILEDSGLRQGREYRMQVSIRGRNGETLQPDAIVDLPECRQLVVDSKVSNKAWTEYCGENDEVKRRGCLLAHIASLRAHVKGLAGRDYSASPDLQTVDFVLMFVPVEAALLTALATDETLYTDAYRSKVILVSPSTLMAVVRLVEGLWTLQKRKESADEIAEAGRKLYEKLTNFAQTFVAMGAAIENVQSAYEKATGQLSTGKANAIRLAEHLKELGVRSAPGKEIPAALLDADQNHAQSDTAPAHAMKLEASLFA